MSHADAGLTPTGGLFMVQRIGSGRTVADIAADVDHSSVVRCQLDRTAARVDSRVRSMPHLTLRGLALIADRCRRSTLLTVDACIPSLESPLLRELAPVTGGR